MKRSLPLALLLLAAFAPPALAVGPGKIQGTVNPVEFATEVEVCLVEGATPSDTCTVPAANGSYALVDVPLGPQQVEFLPSFRSRLIPQYYDHKNRLSEAATISITSNSLNKGGISADLIAGGVIKGTVTALGTGGLAEVEVCAKSVASPPVSSCSETDPGGEYELHSLPTGTYKVGFWGRGVSAEYQTQYYNGSSTFAQATPVAVTNGGEITGIDVALARGSAVGGTLRAASTGASLPAVSVCLFAASNPGPERCTYSDGSGAYRFQGLPSGSYQVGFSLGLSEIGGEGVAGEEDGFQTQFYPGVATRAEAQTLPLIAPQTMLAIDASLLAPPMPAPPAPPLVLPTAIVPAPPAVAVPPTKKGCKPGYRKQKVKGKARCVKVQKKKRKHHKKKHTADS
jgi:hypothetical protein